MKPENREEKFQRKYELLKAAATIFSTQYEKNTQAAVELAYTLEQRVEQLLSTEG